MDIRNYKTNIFVKLLFLLFPVACFAGCEKFLDIKPAGVVMPDNLSDYRAMLTRVYQGFPTDLAKLSLRSDEVKVNFDGVNASYRPSYEEIYTWIDNGSLSTVTTQWQSYYYSIYVSNYLIKLLANASDASDDTKQLVGEAYLIRAYSYFLLANIYGQPYSDESLSSLCVPLVLDNDVEEVRVKSTLKSVYEQVEQDIEASFGYLQVDRWEPSLRYRFGRDAARAFACRVALYKKDWKRAIEKGISILSSSYELEDLNSSSSKLPCHYRSSEAIMNMDLVMDGDYLSIMRASDLLIASYASGDRRKDLYFRTPSAGDYRVQRGDEKKGESTAYRITFRLGEVLLNVAEAQARLGSLLESKTLLKQLAKKRYSESKIADAEVMIDAKNTSEELLEFILAERGRELAFEGLRWFDLRRFGCPQISHKLDEEEYTLNEKDSRYTLPIPREAKASNSNL